VLNKLKCGELEVHKFLPNNAPPRCDPNMPREDVLGEMKLHPLLKK